MMLCHELPEELVRHRRGRGSRGAGAQGGPHPASGGAAGRDLQVRGRFLCVPRAHLGALRLAPRHLCEIELSHAPCSERDQREAELQEHWNTYERALSYDKEVTHQPACIIPLLASVTLVLDECSCQAFLAAVAVCLSSHHFSPAVQAPVPAHLDLTHIVSTLKI